MSLCIYPVQSNSIYYMLIYRSSPTTRWILYSYRSEHIVEHLIWQSQGQVSKVLLSRQQFPHRFYSVCTMAPFGGREYAEEFSIRDLLIVSLSIIFYSYRQYWRLHNVCGEQVSFTQTNRSWPEPTIVKQWLMPFFSVFIFSPLWRLELCALIKIYPLLNIRVYNILEILHGIIKQICACSQMLKRILLYWRSAV